MRLLSLLIGLVIVAYLLSQQLTPESPSSEANELIGDDGVTPPSMPTTPAGLNEFEVEMNQFMQNAASERSKDLEDMEDSLINR